MADVCLYPYSPEASRLPVYVAGLGGTAYQQPVRRPEGYFWHQLLLCVEGNGTLETGGQTQPVQPGDVFFLPAGCAHAYWPEAERWEVRWIALDGSAAAALPEQLEMTQPQIVRGGAAVFLPLYERMLAAISSDRLHGPYACSALAYSCLMEMRRMIVSRGDARNRILSQTLRYIDENHYRDVSLAEMAENAGVTPQHLCRVFRETMHMRPGEYLTQRRVQAAQALLREEALTLAQIADRVGFSSPAYFGTVFRRCVGITPGEYRRRMTGG